MIYDLSNPLDQEKFKIRCNHLFSKGEKVELVKKVDKRISDEDLRSLRQNRTIHMWFTVISDEVGLNKEDCKRDVKRAILGQKPHMNNITGKIEYVDYKTSEMTISELQSFMEKVKIWAAQELGCYLPYHGDPGYEDMADHCKNR